MLDRLTIVISAAAIYKNWWDHLSRPLRAHGTLLLGMGAKHPRAATRRDGDTPQPRKPRLPPRVWPLRSSALAPGVFAAGPGVAALAGSKTRYCRFKSRTIISTIQNRAMMTVPTPKPAKKGPPSWVSPSPMMISITAKAYCLSTGHVPRTSISLCGYQSACDGQRHITQGTRRWRPTAFFRRIHYLFHARTLSWSPRTSSRARPPRRISWMESPAGPARYS